MYCTPYGQNFPATPLGGVAAHAAGACDVVETGERSSCDRQRAIKSTSTSGYFTTALAEDRGASQPRRLATSRRRWPRTVAPVDLDVRLLHDGAGRGPWRQSTSTSGYFTTALAEDRGAASSLCPWTVDAQPGQRVNLTLYSFPIASDSAVGDSDSQRRPGHGL